MLAKQVFYNQLICQKYRMRTFPYIVIIMALWIIFVSTLYLAFGITFPTLLLAVVSIVGVAVSIFTYRYYGWPYAERGSYADLKPGDLNSMIEKEGPLAIIDVRTPAEFAKGHLPQSVNMPYTRVVRGLSVDSRTVFVSGTGRRSRAVIRKVIGKELYNLREGYTEWVREQFPVEK